MYNLPNPASTVVLNLVLNPGLRLGPWPAAWFMPALSPESRMLLLMSSRVHCPKAPCCTFVMWYLSFLETPAAETPFTGVGRVPDHRWQDQPREEPSVPLRPQLPLYLEKQVRSRQVGRRSLSHSHFFCCPCCWDSSQPHRQTLGYDTGGAFQAPQWRLGSLHLVIH